MEDLKTLAEKYALALVTYHQLKNTDGSKLAYMKLCDLQNRLNHLASELA